MPFDIKQMPASTEHSDNEVDEQAGKLRRFKFLFAGTVLLCLVVIIGSAILYYLDIFFTFR